jgi:hypothetical protein
MPHAVWEHTRQVNLDGSFYIVQGDSQISHVMFEPQFRYLPSGCKSDERPGSTRWFYHRHILHLGIGGGRITMVRINAD